MLDGMTARSSRHGRGCVLGNGRGTRRGAFVASRTAASFVAPLPSERFTAEDRAGSVSSASQSRPRPRSSSARSRGARGHVSSRASRRSLARRRASRRLELATRWSDKARRARSAPVTSAVRSATLPVRMPVAARLKHGSDGSVHLSLFNPKSLEAKPLFSWSSVVVAAAPPGLVRALPRSRTAGSSTFASASR